MPNPDAYIPMASSTLKSSSGTSILLALALLTSLIELCLVTVLLLSVLVVVDSIKLEVLVQAERTLARLSRRSNPSGMLGGTLSEIYGLPGVVGVVSAEDAVLSFFRLCLDNLSFRCLKPSDTDLELFSLRKPGPTCSGAREVSSGEAGLV